MTRHEVTPAEDGSGSPAGRGPGAAASAHIHHQQSGIELETEDIYTKVCEDFTITEKAPTRLTIVS